MADFSACGGKLRLTKPLTIESIPAYITDIVGEGTSTFKDFPNGTTFPDKNIYTTSPLAYIVINDSDASFPNPKLNSAGNITLSAGTIENKSLLVTTNTGGNITLDGGTVRDSTIVAKGEFRHNSSDEIDNTSVFSNTITIIKGSGNVTAGIFYSQSDTTFPDAVGNLSFGSCSSCNINDCTSSACNPLLNSRREY